MSFITRKWVNSWHSVDSRWALSRSPSSIHMHWLAFLHNDNEAAKKVFDVLAPRYAERNGGYTRILKLDNRQGDDALMVILELVEGK